MLLPSLPRCSTIIIWLAAEGCAAINGRAGLINAAVADSTQIATSAARLRCVAHLLFAALFFAQRTPLQASWREPHACHHSKIDERFTGSRSWFAALQASSNAAGHVSVSPGNMRAASGICCFGHRRTSGPATTGFAWASWRRLTSWDGRVWFARETWGRQLWCCRYLVAA